MLVNTETGEMDMDGDQATYAYMVIDSVWIFKVVGSERYMKRYNARGIDGSLAAALDQLGIGG